MRGAGSLAAELARCLLTRRHMRWLFFLVPLLASCTTQCVSDSQCADGAVCVQYAFIGESGSTCVKLCGEGGTCEAGTTCTGCPESPQRCRRVDGTPSGGFCCAPNTRCL